ncbi:MAG: ptrA 2 [Frankiales bacterium]|nr:ptrA 2 [Frankiales bacterium]
MSLQLALTDTRLANGLRVVVHSDHTSPVVAVNVWYGVGSRHEQLHRTGFAHLFEHLMFQGSRQVKGTDHFSILQGVGATLNGTTSFDRTNYFETVPSHAVEVALWLEADRMGSLLEAVNQESLDNQRDVVKNERRQRYDNVPYGTAWERIFAGVFPDGHPYQHMPIGSMEHLDAASLDDVHAFFTSWYAPDNAVLSLVGDITPDDGLALAERYFGGIAAKGGFEAARDGVIGPIDAPLRVEVRGENVPSEALYIVFRVPADGTADCDAVELALMVLTEGASSRLVTRLVREDKTAQFVSGGVQRLIGGTGLGLLTLRTMPGAELADLEAVIAAELARFAAEGPTELELERVRAQSERAFLDSISTVEGLADQLGRNATLFDDPGRVSTALASLLAVDAEAVREAAARLLTPQNQFVLTYHLPEAAA